MSLIKRLSDTLQRHLWTAKDFSQCSVKKKLSYGLSDMQEITIDVSVQSGEKLVRELHRVVSRLMDLRAQKFPATYFKDYARKYRDEDLYWNKYLQEMRNENPERPERDVKVREV